MGLADRRMSDLSDGAGFRWPWIRRFVDSWIRRFRRFRMRALATVSLVIALAAAASAQAPAAQLKAGDPAPED